MPLMLAQKVAKVTQTVYQFSYTEQSVDKLLAKYEILKVSPFLVMI